MKCPICKKEGKKSKCFNKDTVSTLAAYPSYYDEESNFHHHDLNMKKTMFTCSEGHEFFAESKGSTCPSYPENCDFNPEVKLVYHQQEIE